MRLRTVDIGFIFISFMLTAVLLVFWPTFRSLADLDSGSDSSTQAIFVLVAFVIILWRLREDTEGCPIRPFWWGLVGLFGLGLIWLLGELMLVRVVTYVAAIALIPMAVLTVMGYRWFCAVSFPLSFLLLAIPIDGSVVPALVGWTANFAFLGLDFTGIPIHREGAFLVVPSGAWSIADSCSGVRYLSACVTLGALYGWSMYRSLFKRAAFILGAVVLGITGNWLRAYLTILIAHLSDNRLLREDHGAFGWWLFAILLACYFWLGWRHRDLEDRKRGVTRNDLQPPAPAQLGQNDVSWEQSYGVVGAALLMIGIWPIINDRFTMRPSEQEKSALMFNLAAEKSWRAVENSSLKWSPALANPRQDYRKTFERNGQRVEIYIGIFKNQTWKSKLIGSANQWVSAETSSWSLVERGMAKTQFLGQALDVDTATVQGAGQRILAWRWYWIDGEPTASVAYAKLLQLRARLGRRDDVSAWISIYTPVNDGAITDAATALSDFVRSMDSALAHSLAALETQKKTLQDKRNE